MSLLGGGLIPPLFLVSFRNTASVGFSSYLKELMICLQSVDRKFWIFYVCYLSTLSVQFTYCINEMIEASL